MVYSNLLRETPELSSNGSKTFPLTGYISDPGARKNNRGILTILNEGADCEGFSLGTSNRLIEAFNLKSALFNFCNIHKSHYSLIG